MDRRVLAAKPPAFERVYYVSIHDLTEASVSETYPGTPNRHCVGKSDEQLAAMNVRTPHPLELIRGDGVVPLRPGKARPSSENDPAR